MNQWKSKRSHIQMSCGIQLKHKIWRKNIHKNALAIWMYFNASNANTATIIIIINWHWAEHTNFFPWNKGKMTIVGWLCRLQHHYFFPSMAFCIECLIFRHFDVYAINASNISMARFGLLFSLFQRIPLFFLYLLSK